ncbi:unnamed protein product [Cochlearia groenlandica]
MQLLISCGEVSSSQINLLRLLNQSLDFVCDNVAKIFAPIFTNHQSSLYCVERPRFTIHDNHWKGLCDKSDLHEPKEDPEAIFNALDSILRSSLDRLASLRESVCWTKSFVYDDCYVSMHASMMRDLCSQGKLDAALWLRKKMMHSGFVIPGLVTHNHLLNGLCKAGLVDKADVLLREMWEMGPCPNSVSYNTFIKGLCSVNNVDKALYLFSTLEGKYGIKPNRVTCNIIVHALCQKGLIGSSNNSTKLFEEILDGSQGKSAPLDIVTCTILMDRYFKNGNVVQALELWKEMLSLENSPPADSVVYNVIIRGLCSSRNMVAAYGFICDMVKRGVNRDVFTYNTLISSLCKQGKFDEACNIHGTMQRVGVAPDHISYKVIIQGLCIHGDVDRANEFLLSMLRSSLLPEVLLWNVVIDGYGRYGDTSSALSVRNLMLSYGVKPNIYTNNGLIHGYVKAGRFIDACRLKDQMPHTKIYPDTTTYNLLIGAACTFGQLRLAFQLYDEMRQRGCRPDIITYTELIRGLCWKGRLEEADNFLQRMQVSGITMDHVPFRILMKKYSRLRRPEEAYLVYEKWLMTRNQRVSVQAA